jgi:hypothetical protein
MTSADFPYIDKGRRWNAALASVWPVDEAVPVVFNARNARRKRRAQGAAESAERAWQPAVRVDDGAAGVPAPS